MIQTYLNLENLQAKSTTSLCQYSMESSKCIFFLVTVINFRGNIIDLIDFVKVTELAFNTELLSTTRGSPFFEGILRVTLH